MIGVVVLSYNHPNITANCLKSVLEQVNAKSIALFHNGSETKWVDQLTKEFPSIAHWSTDENKGYASGVNQALAHAFKKWSWVFLLTNDTKLIRWSGDIPIQPGIYSPKVYLRRTDRIDYQLGYFNSVTGKIWHAKDAHLHAGYPIKNGVFTYAPGSAFLISTEVFNSVGSFDEGLHTYWEDVDFGARACLNGFAPLTWPQIELIHLGGKTTRKDPFYTNFLFKRNRRRVSWRYCPTLYKPALAANLALDFLR